MSGLLSIYLDLVRFLAAVGVLLWHAGQNPVSTSVLPQVFFNHKLVIIFFVISGYVIAASASRPDRSLANYSADRLARLSSVMIPALVLTYCLDAIGSRVSPDTYLFINPHWQSLRFFANFFYCQQIWFLCVVPSSNSPFWSLGYEFWYYALFGIWLFVRAKWTKLLLCLAVSLFIGPKILLLFPAWMAGALAFYTSKACQSTRGRSLMLFFGTGVATLLALVFEDQLGLNNGKAGAPPLYYSSNAVGDNIFAMLVAAHFVGCALLSRHVSTALENQPAVKWIRWMAGHTFSLYVYHLPILLFIRAITHYDPHSPIAVLAAISFALLTIVGLSKITEEPYPAVRSLLRRWITRLLGRFQHQTTRRPLAPSPQSI